MLKYETPVKRKVESRDDDNKLPTCSLGIFIWKYIFDILFGKTGMNV